MLEYWLMLIFPNIFLKKLSSTVKVVFYVNVVYEWLPKFCSNFFTIGHSVPLYNKWHVKNKDDKSKPTKQKEKGGTQQRITS